MSESRPGNRMARVSRATWLLTAALWSANLHADAAPVPASQSASAHEQAGLDAASLLIAERYNCRVTGVTDFHEKNDVSSSNPAGSDRIIARLALTPNPKAAGLVRKYAHDNTIIWDTPQGLAFLQPDAHPPKAVRNSQLRLPTLGLGANEFHEPDSSGLPLQGGAPFYPRNDHRPGTAAEIYTFNRILTHNTNGSDTDLGVDVPCGTIALSNTVDAEGRRTWQVIPSLQAEPLIIMRDTSMPQPAIPDSGPAPTSTH